jgi:2,3-dihydroxyethylbenzene 1,2-dioxygenase
MGVSQLGYVGIGVSNMQAWEEFVTEVLGMEIADRAPDGSVYVRMDEYHHRFILHPTGEDDVTYTAWQAPSELEFEALKAHMLEGGVEWTQGTEEEIASRMVRDMVKFEVAGITHEIYYGLKVLWERPFTPGRPFFSGFRTGDLGLGHIGFGIEMDQIPEATRIFRDVLGFKMSDWIGPTPFFHVNPREHCLTFPPRRDPSNTKKTGHFMVETNSLDDVGACLDLVTERGIELTSTLGKHTNDHMVSFYMRNPSGFGVEYGWGGRLIDDNVWQVNTYDRANIWGHRRQGQPGGPQPAAPAR